MFNLLQTTTDDQTALGACLLTLAGAAVLVFASFHFGPAGKRLRDSERKKSGLRVHPGISAESDRLHERAA